MPPYRTITSNEEPVFFTEDIWPLIIKNCLVTFPLKPKKIVGVGIRIIFRFIRLILPFFTSFPLDDQLLLIIKLLA